MKTSISGVTTRELCIFAMLGSLTYLSKLLLASLPNIHMVGMLIMVYTIVYRKKALIPIYVFVFLAGLFDGFNFWWIPYLYVWAVLWAVTMLLPQNMPVWGKWVVYPFVCAAHGLAFGILYAPVQAVIFGYSFKTTIAWIVSGLPFDVSHAVGNLFFGFLIVPLSVLLNKLEYNTSFRKE